MITNDLDITEPFFDLHILSHQNGLLLLQLQQPHFVLQLLHLVEFLFWGGFASHLCSQGKPKSEVKLVTKTRQMIKEPREEQFSII